MASRAWRPRDGDVGARSNTGSRNPAGQGAVFTGLYGFADSNKDRRAVTSTPVLKQDHKK